MVDLTRALAHDPVHDIELMPLDRLEVRSRERAVIRPKVTIIGPVQYPGQYELTAGLRVSDLVAIAGNVLPEAYYDEAELIRRVYDDEERRLDVRRFRFDLGKALSHEVNEDPVLQNGDQLVIRSMRSDQVTVSIDGLVRFPGTYVFPAGARLTELVAAAGGVLPDGDLRATVFARRSVQRLQQDRFADLTRTTRERYESTLETMVQTGQSREGLSARLALDQTQSLLQRMELHQAVGRIVIPFQRDDFPDSRFNLTLEEGDTLRIPRRQETVTVIGHVFTPSTFVAEPGLSVANVLDRAGGTTDFADDERIYVVRADGNVQSLDQPTRRLTQRTVLLPGDVLLVPRKPLERTFGAQLADALGLARQAAEIGLLLSHLGDGTGNLDVTTVLQPPMQSNDASFNQAILGGNRR